MSDNISNPPIDTIDTDFDKEADTSIIKVIGVGGGGSNAVNYMFRQNIPHINFVVCNTDKQALKLSPVPNRLLIGDSITHGRGAGNIPEIGRQCAEADVDAIRELFNDNTEMVFITAGMGGGTGTGAAPVVARLAREANVLSIGIVTVPFLFEGDKKILKALEGANEMRKHVDALLVINNENLIELYPDLNFFNAFGKADDTLANAARSISDIISEPCYINVDFQDVKTTLKDSGTAIISTAEGEGPHRISDAIRNALHSPLLKAHDIYTAKRLMLKFVCWRDSPNPLRSEEIGEIHTFTSQLPPTIDVKWGIADNPAMGDKVKITVLASGFDVTLRESEEKGPGPIILEADFEQDKTSKGPEQSAQKDKTTIAEIYGHDKIKNHNRQVDKQKYAVLTPDQFDNFEVIALLERTPAFNRAPNFNDALTALSQPGTDVPGTAATNPENTDTSGNSPIIF